jgi:hypothetical protein
MDGIAPEVVTGASGGIGILYSSRTTRIKGKSKLSPQYRNLFLRSHGVADRRHIIGKQGERVAKASLLRIYGIDRRC